MKYPFIQQQGEEDCGAACLASIARHHGLKMSLRQIRETVGTSMNGTNLWLLQQGAEKLGFNARPVKASPEVLDRLQEAPLPAVIHWNQNHWVVLYGKRGSRFVVVDPGMGVRHLSAAELMEGWQDWVMLILEPDPQRFAVPMDESTSGSGHFIRRVWMHRSLLGQAIAINSVVGLLSLASPILIQFLTDDVLIREDFKLLNTVATVVIVMTLVSHSLEFVQANLIAHFAQRLELGLVLDFCRQILRLPLNYYETRRSGEIVSRLQDIQQLNYLVSQVIVNLPSQFFVALISLALMAFYSWKLTLVAVAMAIAMTVSVVLFQPTLQRKTQKSLITDAENQGVLVETFKGALTLKTIGAAPQFWHEFQGRFGRLASLNLKSHQIGIMNNSLSGAIAGVGGVALLWFGSALVIDPADNFSVGQLLAFKGMNDNFLSLIVTVIGFVDEFTRVKAATQRLAEVTEADPEDQNRSSKPAARIAPDASITCHHLSFDYPGRANLLTDVSLRIPGGQVTALIGQSGCGKSTLAKLLAGLYPLQNGNIRIGVYNQDDLSLDSLRQQVVLVPQEPHFWSRSIIENFQISFPDASFEQIVEMCHLVGADEFISQLPNKYQTVLGEFAANLSGGQRQRLAIARALLHNPPILILDESTSALDPVGEQQLMDRLLQSRSGKTTILISHRPTVIERADWLLLLEQGHLKRQGNCSEILSQIGYQIDSLYTTSESSFTSTTALTTS